MNALTKKHAKMLETIAAACADEQTQGEFQVVSEWLGYLPFGLTIWVDVGSRTHVEQGFALDGEAWDSADFETLSARGYLVEIDRGVHSPDGMDTTVRYRLTDMALNRPR